MKVIKRAIVYIMDKLKALNYQKESKKKVIFIRLFDFSQKKFGKPINL